MDKSGVKKRLTLYITYYRIFICFSLIIIYYLLFSACVDPYNSPSCRPKPPIPFPYSAVSNVFVSNFHPTNYILNSMLNCTHTHAHAYTAHTYIHTPWVSMCAIKVITLFFLSPSWYSSTRCCARATLGTRKQKHCCSAYPLWRRLAFHTLDCLDLVARLPSAIRAQWLMKPTLTLAHQLLLINK